MSGALVTVVINVFNGERYIKEALLSVLRQRFTLFKVLVWDNCSEDRTASIVAEFCSDPRLQIYRNEKHCSLASARNFAAKMVTTEWLLFLDSDDLLMPDALDVFSRVASASDVQVGLIYGTAIVFGKGIKERALFPEFNSVSPPSGHLYLELLRRGDFIPLQSAFIRRAAYEMTKGIDLSLNQAEDFDLFLQLSRVCRVIGVPVAFSKYRVHGGNLSRKFPLDFYMEPMKIISREAATLGPEARATVLRGAVRGLAFLYGYKAFRARLYRVGLYYMLTRGGIPGILWVLKKRRGR